MYVLKIPFSKSLIILFLIISIFILPINSAKAMGVPGFSGYPTVPIPCLCSVTLWTWLAPLWLTIVPITGPMVYVPYATILHPWFTIAVPASSHVGAYIPGVQACWQFIGFACAPIPAIGAMMWVGTGIPGASLPAAAAI